jgi:hypothetical protein
MDGPYCNAAAREVLKKLKAEENGGSNPIWKGLEKFKDMGEQ